MTDQPHPIPTTGELVAEANRLLALRDFTFAECTLAEEVMGCLSALASRLSTEEAKAAAPIPMILHCPACGLQHIDAANEHPSAHPDGRETMWTNPPHRSHLCAGCGHIWRPADVPTEGVAEITTRGKADNPIQAKAAGGIETLQRYRAVTHWIGADSWDGCSDCMNLLRWAAGLDDDRDMTQDEIAAITSQYRNDGACKKDQTPCYVGEGTEDAHWRCGTVQCGAAPPSVGGKVTREEIARIIMPHAFDINGPHADDSTPKMRDREWALTKADAIMHLIAGGHDV